VRSCGKPILVDPGTFSYNAPDGWRHLLRVARVHNGPLIDDVDPAVPGPRFLWLRWPDARLDAIHETGNDVVIEASRPEAVRRTVRIRPSRVEVEDESLAADAKELVVRWLLEPDADPNRLRVDSGTLSIDSAAEGADGQVWYAPAYGSKIRSTAVEARVRESDGVLKMRTVIDTSVDNVLCESEETVDAATAS
jgi:hypothetical protein